MAAHNDPRVALPADSGSEDPPSSASDHEDDKKRIHRVLSAKRGSPTAVEYFRQAPRRPSRRTGKGGRGRIQTRSAEEEEEEEEQRVDSARWLRRTVFAWATDVTRQSFDYLNGPSSIILAALIVGLVLAVVGEMLADKTIGYFQHTKIGAFLGLFVWPFKFVSAVGSEITTSLAHGLRSPFTLSAMMSMMPFWKISGSQNAQVVVDKASVSQLGHSMTDVVILATRAEPLYQKLSESIRDMPQVMAMVRYSTLPNAEELRSDMMDLEKIAYHTSGELQDLLVTAGHSAHSYSLYTNYLLHDLDDLEKKHASWFARAGAAEEYYEALYNAWVGYLDRNSVDVARLQRSCEGLLGRFRSMSKYAADMADFVRKNRQDTSSKVAVKECAFFGSSRHSQELTHLRQTLKTLDEIDEYGQGMVDMIMHFGMALQKTRSELERLREALEKPGARCNVEVAAAIKEMRMSAGTIQRILNGVRDGVKSMSDEPPGATSNP